MQTMVIINTQEKETSKYKLIYILRKSKIFNSWLFSLVNYLLFHRRHLVIHVLIDKKSIWIIFYLYSNYRNRIPIVLSINHLRCVKIFFFWILDNDLLTLEYASHVDFSNNRWIRMIDEMLKEGFLSKKVAIKQAYL